MAKGSISVVGLDGQLGYAGPVGAMTWACFGVAALASPIADQKPLVIASPADAETLLGDGPLRDHLVCALTGTGGSVVVMPLQRSAGGTVLGTAARSNGSMDVTAVAGYVLGGHQVMMRWAIGGVGGTAALQLIINGLAYSSFSPAAAAYASPLDIPEASLGPLANGVAAADRFSPTVEAPVTATPAVAGDSVDFEFGEPAFASTDTETAVNRLAAHRLNWRFVMPAGFVTPGVWATFDETIRLLPNQGKFVRGMVQLAGPQLVSGASSVTLTPAWVSAYSGDIANAPTRHPNPRTGACATWSDVTDPIRGVERTLPMTYPLAASMSARLPQQPPEATKHGPMVTDPRTRVQLLKVNGIHPADFDVDAHSTQLDNAWVTTLTRYSGRDGVYPTHVRLWGQPPEAGVTGSDYSGIERGFVVDEVSTRIYHQLFGLLNDDIDTGPDGRMSPSARAHGSSLANAGIASALQDRMISAGEAEVIGKEPGILQTGTILVRIRIVPRGKAEQIDVTVAFAAGIAQSEEVAA